LLFSAKVKPLGGTGESLCWKTLRKLKTLTALVARGFAVVVSIRTRKVRKCIEKAVSLPTFMCVYTIHHYYFPIRRYRSAKKIDYRYLFG
jgi:hypothetical protein